MSKKIVTATIPDKEDTTGKLEAEVRKADYLIAALKDLGTAKAGLVLGHIIAAMDSNEMVKSYMSGDADLNPTAFAAGVENFGMTNETKKVDIRHDGKAILEDAEIKGKITAKSGIIEKLTMAENGVIELPPMFTSSIKGAITSEGISLVYQGSNSQKIEWYTGTGTFAGLIAPNSQGHLSLSSSFGVGIQSQLINIGTEAFAGNINIGSGLAEIDFNGSSIDNIKEMTNIGYTSMASLTFFVPNNTSLILRHDTPLSILTSVGSNSFLKSIYMNDNNLLRDGAIKWILNRSTSGISIAADGNIRINSGDYASLQSYSLTPFIYSAGYWYKHSDHR